MKVDFKEKTHHSPYTLTCTVGHLVTFAIVMSRFQKYDCFEQIKTMFIPHLSSSEVEVTKLLGPDHHGVGGVGAWGNPVQLVLRLSGDQVEVLLAEPIVCHL